MRRVRGGGVTPERVKISSSSFFFGGEIKEYIHLLVAVPFADEFGLFELEIVLVKVAIVPDQVKLGQAEEDQREGQDPREEQAVERHSTVDYNGRWSAPL